jgi:uncharacterized membrane protein
MAGRTISRVWLWTVVAFSAVIALTAYRYLLPHVPGGSPGVLANQFAHTGALAVHAGLAATALLIGPFQFFPGIRTRRRRLHRRLGTVYVLCVLGGGSAGLVLSLGTSAGPVAGAGFGLLAILWLGFTANAWRLATRRAFAAHERWMTRSFALTLAAVTLRLYLPLAMVLNLDMATAYPAIAWLCWVPNLIAAEIYLALRSDRLAGVSV